jgi:hypothetical protein
MRFARLTNQTLLPFEVGAMLGVFFALLTAPSFRAGTSWAGKSPTLG